MGEIWLRYVPSDECFGCALIYTRTQVRSSLSCVCAWWSCEQIPAGMLDGDGNFKGVAAKEMEEETGLKMTMSELIDLTAKEPRHHPGIFPSPGGTFFPLSPLPALPSRDVGIDPNFFSPFTTTTTTRL